MFDRLYLLLHNIPGVSAFIQMNDQSIYLFMDRAGMQTSEYFWAVEIPIQHGNIFLRRNIVTSLLNGR
jgi:hypothetical protein